MMIFSEETTRRVTSPWGAEVKKKLIDRGMRQDDLVKKLREGGFDIKKSHLTNLLYGIGVSSRKLEIEFINKLLEIPFTK